jgi:hypothetical protein
MAVDCRKAEYKRLKMFGFGVPGQGFYTMNFPEAKIKTHQNTGLLVILAGEATEEKVDRELKNLVREEWDFKVKQIHIHEFLVVFPDKVSLETFSKFSEFQMSLYGLKGKVEKTAREYDTSSILHTIWMKIHGVPDLARDVDSIKEIAGLVMEPLVVDELSIIKEDPVRVQGRCINPGAIKGAIEVFFNGSGKLIKFEVEGGKPGSGKGGMGDPPGSDQFDDKSDKDRDKHSKKDQAKKNMSKFDRVGQIDKEMDTNHEDSMEEDLENLQGYSGVNEEDYEQVVDTPLAVFCPGVGVVDLQAGGQFYGDRVNGDSRGTTSEMAQEVGEGADGSKDKEQGKAGGVIEGSKVLAQSDAQILVHGKEGCNLMDKCKWPKLTTPKEKECQITEEMEVLTQEETLVKVQDSQNMQKTNLNGVGCPEDMMDDESFMDKDSEGEQTVWQAPKSRKVKKHKKVVMATRTSSRVPRDGIPIAKKTAQRAMEINSFTGTNSNPFTILNNCPNSVLQSVIVDLDLEMGNVDECLDAFKAEEIARAKIAEAKYNSFLEKQNQKTAPKTVEEEHDLTMQVISNVQRDFILDSLKGRDDSMNSNEHLGADITQKQK